MSYVARIRKVASQMASEADNRATALKRQLAELEVQIVQVETQLNAANLAYERLTASSLNSAVASNAPAAGLIAKRGRTWAPFPPPTQAKMMLFDVIAAASTSLFHLKAELLRTRVVRDLG